MSKDPTIGRTNLSLSLNTRIDSPSTLSAIWHGIKERGVAIIGSRAGAVGVAFTVSFVFGVAIVSVIDLHFKTKEERDDPCAYGRWEDSRLDYINQLSPTEKNLNDRLRTIYLTNCAALFIGGVLALMKWKAYSFYDAKIKNILVLSSIVMGFVLGTQTMEYYNRNNDRKIREFVNCLKQNKSTNMPRVPNLSYYSDYLRYFNPIKLANEIHKQFRSFSPHDYQSLILRGCRLTDYDLKRLGESRWFSYFSEINVSDNHRLTCRGIELIGKEGGETLQTLNLSRTDLTDDDLKHMAESGCLNHLKELIIKGNPKITSQGLAWIGKKGFDSLNMLDIGSNPQLLGNNLDYWAGVGGFKKIRALGLSDCNIVFEDLERLINNVEWFRNLRGLDLSSNLYLKKFPPNISQMINLDTVGSGRGPFTGSGLFFREHSQDFEKTKEYIQLVLAHKVVDIWRPYHEICV